MTLINKKKKATAGTNGTEVDNRFSVGRLISCEMDCFVVVAAPAELIKTIAKRNVKVSCCSR